MNNTNSTKTIYLAGGCFWGVEAYMKRIGGILDAVSGYANGNTEHPSYEDLVYRNSGHAETVKVIYNSDRIRLEQILKYYLRVVDPTSLNKQGNDRGVQYRTGVYYTDANDKAIIEAVLAKEQEKYDRPIVIEVLPLIHFYDAEEYHQDYLQKNPGGYCHIDLSLANEALEDEISENAIPENRDISNKSNETRNDSQHKPTYQRPSDATLRETLTDLQYRVTMENATERPFTNEYWNQFEKGIYVDITSGEPLFTSMDKFNSGCGWPSFSKPIEAESIEYIEDKSHNMLRMEVRSMHSDIHLGHVFEDGPKELGGLRYCINSASIRFIPYKDMEKEGYGYLLNLFQ